MLFPAGTHRPEPSIARTPVPIEGASAWVTRLWPEGQPIAMTTLATTENTDLFSRHGPAIEDVPSQFIWQGGTHLVSEITRYWRIDIDWWRERIWRAYFKLRTDTGLLVVIYLDLISGEWFLQRLYD